MAFEGDLGGSTMANTLFPFYQRETSLNVGGGINGGVPFMSVPCVPLQELNSGPSIPWSHNTHGDPCEVINHAKNRKPSDVADDGETELQGLVSNILDEAESQDSFYCDGNQHSNIWSPKILRDELLQYFQSEPKTQYNSNFAPNYSSHDAFGKAQGQAAMTEAEGLCQATSNGFNANQHPLFNFPNGVRDIFSPQHGPAKPPPGLPLPPTMSNTYMTPLQPNSYDSSLHVLRPQGGMNGADLFYQDHYNRGMDQQAPNEQYSSQDLNQLISSFQSFAAGEEGSGKFPNVPVKPEDNKWESPGPFMRAQGNHSRPMGADLARERDGAVRKQPFKRDSLPDLPPFNLQATEFSPQAKFSLGGHQNKMQENTSFPLNMNQFQKHPVQQSPLMVKPPMQKEKKRISGVFGDGFNAPGLSGNILMEEKRPALSQNHFYNLPVSAHPPRFERENNNMIAAGSSQQFTPVMYEQRRLPNRLQSPSFSPRSSLAFRGGVDVAEMTGFSSSGFNNVMMRRGGESTFHGMSPGLTSPAPVNQGQPVVQLFLHLDECYEQWRSLERERKRTEIVLSKTFLGKRSTAFPNSSLPKTPPNSSKVDHLIVNQMREQARVSSLLDKMECLSGVPISANVYAALSKHNAAISVTSARRREEIGNTSHQRQRAAFTVDKVSETMMLVVALMDLTATTRKLRTAVWCALQMTLPKPAPRAEPTVSEEKPEETGPAPSDGYSYRI